MKLTLDIDNFKKAWQKANCNHCYCIETEVCTGYKTDPPDSIHQGMNSGTVSVVFTKPIYTKHLLCCNCKNSQIKA